MAHNPLRRVQHPRRDAAELRGFLLERPEPRDLIDQRLGIQLPSIEPLTPVGRRWSDEVIDVRGDAHDRAVEVQAAVLAVQERTLELCVQRLHRGADRHRLLARNGQHQRRDFFAQGGGIVEQRPGAGVVDRHRDVAAFGVFLALMVQRVRMPHPGRRTQLRRKHAVLGGTIRRHRDDAAVGGIVQDVRHALHDVRVDREQVARDAVARALAVDKAQRAVPRIIRRLQPVEAMNQGVAPGERDGDEIGLKLHLPRQRALQEHDPVEHGVDERANRPHYQAQDPTDPGDA